MKNKNLFRERWLVFDEAVPSIPYTPADGSTQMSVAPEGPKAPEATAAKEEVKLSTVKSLDELKALIAPADVSSDLAKFAVATKLDGFSCDLPADLNKFDSEVPRLAAELQVFYDAKADFFNKDKTLMQLFAKIDANVTPEQAKEAISAIYSNVLMSSVKAQAEVYKEFLADAANKDILKDAKFVLKASGNDQVELKFRDDKHVQAFESYKNAKQAEKDKLTAEGNKTEDEKKREKEQADKIAERKKGLIESPLSLLIIGFCAGQNADGSNETPEQTADRIARGGSMFGALMASLLGIGGFGREIWDSFKGGVSKSFPKAAVMLDQLESGVQSVAKTAEPLNGLMNGGMEIAGVGKDAFSDLVGRGVEKVFDNVVKLSEKIDAPVGKHFVLKLAGVADGEKVTMPVVPGLAYSIDGAFGSAVDTATSRELKKGQTVTLGFLPKDFVLPKKAVISLNTTATTS